MKFRKKPVIIDAVQFTDEHVAAYVFDKTPLPDGVAMGSASYHTERRQVNSFTAHIETLEGRMRVIVGDWIIKGVKGEYYPCKPDIFEATYEPVDFSENVIGQARRC